MPAARSNSDYCLTELRPGNTFISDYVMKPQQKQSPKKQISPDLKINDAVIVEGIKSAANSAPITRANSDYCLRYLRFGSTYVSDYDHDKMKDMPRKPMPTPQIPKSYDEVVAANQAATKGANNAEGPKRVFSEYCFMEMRGSTWVTGTKEIADEADTKTAVEGQAPVTRVISEYCATFLRCGSIRLSDYVKQPKKPLKQSTLPKAEEEDIKTAVDSTVAPPPPPQYPKVVINEEANTEEVIADMEGAKTAKEPEEEADADMEGTKTAKEPEQQYHFFRQVTHLYFLEATTPPL